MTSARTNHPWRTAVVTGASSGIGTAIARQLAAAGVHLVLVARRAERLASSAEELTAAHGVQVETISADLCDAGDLARVADRLRDPDRPVDLLVNCAGLGAAGPFVDGDVATYRHIVDLNVDALVALTHAALGPMVERRRGWVMNVSSLGGHVPGPMFAVYSATKAFVTNFSEALFEEVRRDGVVVTAICPGATDTEFGDIAGSRVDEVPSFLQQSADDVAAEALAATAAGRAVRVTGWINRASAAVTTVLPRSVNRRLSAIVTDRL
jgi:short-subunit dehydrogenase